MAQEETQTQTVEALEKALLKAILKAGRILVLRQELREEVPEEVWSLLEDCKIEDKYAFQYNDDSDFDIFTHPDILGQLDEKEIEIFNQIYDLSQEMGIDELSEIVANYVTKKEQSCTKTGHVWLFLLKKAEKYFNVETDDSEYSQLTYAGQIRYIIKDGSTVLGTIIEDIDYCNRCVSDTSVSIGIQKCVKYEIEKN